MKIKDVRNANDEDLQKELGNARDELLNLRFQHATGALENPARISEVKRTIAKILTVLNERQTTVQGAG